MNIEKVRCIVNPTKECDCILRIEAREMMREFADEYGVSPDEAINLVVRDFESKTPQEQLRDMEEEIEYFIDKNMPISFCHHLPDETD